MNIEEKMRDKFDEQFVWNNGLSRDTNPTGVMVNLKDMYEFLSTALAEAGKPQGVDADTLLEIALHSDIHTVVSDLVSVGSANVLCQQLVDNVVAAMPDASRMDLGRVEIQSVGFSSAEVAINFEALREAEKKWEMIYETMPGITFVGWVNNNPEIKARILRVIP